MVSGQVRSTRRCSPAEDHSVEPIPLKSAILPASWPSTIANESKPIIGRAEGSLHSSGFYSTPVVPTLVIGGTIVWMYGHITVGRNVLTVLGSYRWDSRKRGPESTKYPGLISTVPPLASGSWARYYPRPRRKGVTVPRPLTLTATFLAVYIEDSRKRDACPDGPPWLRERGFASLHRLT